MKKDSTKQKQDEVVNASPTKRFFVEMLTRDIDLQDALLDLLDNCVDGILRSLNGQANLTKPYEGFWAKINFDDQRFTIEDNCGGIPLVIARKYAFMMGRPRIENDANIPTVGMYGIGMKRAIFKMGRSSHVISRTKNESFEVNIAPRWLTDDKNWELPLHFIEALKNEEDETVIGTSVIVEMLYENIKNIFSSTGSSFKDEFSKTVAQHYSYIINKGFRVEVNGEEVKPKPLALLSSDLKPESKKKEITPYMYKATIDGVTVDLVIGFYTQMPTLDEVEEGHEARRRTEDAGWTVICNDRVVVYNNRSRLTGWGDADVPSYHTQFIAISGVVKFQSNDAWKLPITTTKRDLDASSELYLYVKNFMREGLKKFTSYTNKWKTDPDAEKKISERARPTPIEQLLALSPDRAWTKVQGKNSEFRFNLDLPEPRQDNPNRQIRFFKPLAEIRKVSKHLFDDPDVEPKDVGEKCFELISEKIKK